MIDWLEFLYRRNRFTPRWHRRWRCLRRFRIGKKLEGAGISGCIFRRQIRKRSIPAGAQIVLYTAAPVPIVATVVKMESEEGEEPRERGKRQKGTTVDDKYEIPWPIQIVRQTNILPNLEGAVLDTTESRWLIQIDALLDYNFTHAWKAANTIMDVSHRRPFRLLNIHTSNTILCPLNSGDWHEILLPLMDFTIKYLDPFPVPDTHQ